ncbi:hypothetical protein M422DRAFT_29241 [Sphaerobolus stellatus SS14]|uniref:EF-hand domain-containing protein n=1 Tax=Sphaerobolus stellatus (strain SS14) TaxID=990650 RepID=A0A0C9UH93_SPHS4|nr:hypothetical protein M422DRAFT_39018 [Sphaerobolus stellatus SS14]KIJ46371.1 hypothetical protein M422DRAFT_29241 [Sphaerobolus stellatus SS14]
MITCDHQGRISVSDLERALSVIMHRPDEEKLDVDQDGYVRLDHVLDLVKEKGLVSIILDEEAQNIIGQGRELINVSRDAPRKEDIVQD